MGYAIYLLSLWGWVFAVALGAFCAGIGWERRHVGDAGDGDA